MREALQRLREQNLVKVLPGHGTYVSGLSLEELRPVYRLLGELLTIVLELCAPRLTGEGLDFLRRQNEELLRAIRQNETVEAQKASARFYRDLCRLSGNPYLLSLADQLLLLFLRGEFFFFEGKRSPRVCGEKNRAILDALAVGILCGPGRKSGICGWNWRFKGPEQANEQAEASHRTAGHPVPLSQKSPWRSGKLQGLWSL